MSETPATDNVTPITQAHHQLPPLPRGVQKNIAALKQFALCHNVMATGRYEFAAFSAVDQCMNFFKQMHEELSNEITLCDEAAQYPELAPLFERKKKAEGWAEEAKKVEEIENGSA